MERNSGRYSASSDIVILDDDVFVRGLMVEWLDAEGYRVRADTTQRSSDELAAGVRLIIVDLCMPKRNGAETVRALRAARPQAPIIAVSARFLPGIAGSVQAAHRVGVERILPKPFARADLLTAVRELIGPP